MADWKDHRITKRSWDNSYVITKNNMPYHVPNEGEWVDLYKEVDAYATEHPDVVDIENPYVPSEEEKLNAAREDKLAEFDYVMTQNDKALIRPLANNETELVTQINEIQATNRERRAVVASAESIETINAQTPVWVKFEESELVAR